MEQMLNMFQDFLANFGIAGILTGLFVGMMFVSAKTNFTLIINPEGREEPINYC